MIVIIAKYIGQLECSSQEEQCYEVFKFEGAYKGQRINKILIKDTTHIKFKKHLYYYIIARSHSFYGGNLVAKVLKYKSLT